MNGTKRTTNRNELSLSSLARGITRPRTIATTTQARNGIQQQQQQHVETGQKQQQKQQRTITAQQNSTQEQFSTSAASTFVFRKKNSNRNTVNRISEQQQQSNEDTSYTDEMNYSLDNDDDDNEEEEIVFVYSNDNHSSSSTSSSINDSNNDTNIEDDDDDDKNNENDDSTVSTPTYYDPPPITVMLPVSPTTTVTTGTTTVYSSTQKKQAQHSSRERNIDTSVYNSSAGNRNQQQQQQQQQQQHSIRNIDTSMSVQSVTSITTSTSDPITYTNSNTIRKPQLQEQSQHQQQHRQQQQHQQLVATTTNIHELETPIAANGTTTTRGGGVEQEEVSNNYNDYVNNNATTTSEFASTTKQQRAQQQRRRSQYLCCVCIVMWIIIITSIVLGIVFARQYSMSKRFSTSPSSTNNKNSSNSNNNNNNNNIPVVVPFIPTPTILTTIVSPLSPTINNNNNNNIPTSVIENIVLPSTPNNNVLQPRPIQQQMTMPPKLRPVIIVQPQPQPQPQTTTKTKTASPVLVITPRRRPSSVPISQPVQPRPVLNIVPVQQPVEQQPVEQQPSINEVIWTMRPTVQIIGSQSGSQLGTKFTMNTDGTIIVVSENENTIETTTITVFYAKSFLSSTSTSATATTLTGWEKIGQNSLRYVQDSIVSISINDNGTILVISLVNDVIIYQYNTIVNDWEMIRRGIERTRTPTTRQRKTRRMRTLLQNSSNNITSQYYEKEKKQQQQQQDTRQIQSQQQEQEDDIQLSSVTVFGSGVSIDGNIVIFGQVSSLNVNVSDTNRRMSVYSTIYNPTTASWSNNTIIVSKQGTTTMNYDPINIVLSSNGQLVAVSYRKSTSLSTTTVVDVFEYKRIITTDPSSTLSLFRWVLLGTIPSFDNIVTIKCTLYYSSISGQHRIGIGGIQRLDNDDSSSSSITSIPIQVVQYNPITDVWVLVGDTASTSPSLGYGTDLSLSNNGNRIAIKQLQSTATEGLVDELIVIYDYNPIQLDWIRIGEINKTSTSFTTNTVDVSQQENVLFSNDNNWDMYYSSIGNRIFLSIPQYGSSSSTLPDDTTNVTNNVGTILVLEQV